MTGRVPFLNYPFNEGCSSLIDKVINHHLCQELPKYVDDWTHELVQWYWQFDAVARPSFEEILNYLESNIKLEYIKEDVVKQMVVVKDMI